MLKFFSRKKNNEVFTFPSTRDHEYENLILCKKLIRYSILLNALLTVMFSGIFVYTLFYEPLYYSATNTLRIENIHPVNITPHNPAMLKKSQTLYQEESSE